MNNAFVYRSNIISRMMFYCLFIFVFFNLWRAIYASGNDIGYSHVQMVWYLIITELIIFACRSNVFSQMNDDVKNGSISYVISRPTSYIGFQLASSLGNALVNALFFGILALVLGFLFVGPIVGFSLLTLPAILCSAILGMLIQFYCHMMIGLTSFFLEDNLSVFFIFNKLVFMLGAFIPVEFLPMWLQNIAKSLPFSYVAWAPAKLAVDFSWEFFAFVVPRQMLWLGITMVLTMMFYRFISKRLQTNGG